MEKKLNNLLNIEDFKANWRAEQAKKTKRTDTGLDILKENIEEIVPEGSLDLDNLEKGMTTDEKLEEIENLLDELDDEPIEEVINYLREVLLEMEQQGFIDQDTTDRIDDENDGDWVQWVKDVISLPDFPEDSLNGILDIINNEDFEGFSNDEEDVECPDCDGSGQDDEGDDCERCEGLGRVDRPYDIPPDDGFKKFD